MEKDKSFDIFNQKPTTPQKKPLPAKKPTTPPSKPSNEDSSLVLNPLTKRSKVPPFLYAKKPKFEKLPPLKEGELKEVLKKIEAMKDDIEKKLSIIYEKSGLSPQEIDAYFSNPNNFPPEKWELVQKTRKKFQQQVAAITKAKQDLNIPPSKTMSLKARKGKTLGARKNWIPIR